MKSTKWLVQIVKSIMLCLFFVLIVYQSEAQTISLSEIYDAAEQHYPLINRTAIIKQITEENDVKLKKAYLPILQASAQATYQNEVTAIAGGFIAPPKKDQYKIGLSANETLFDGGEIKAQRDLNEVSGAISLQQNEIDLYTVKERASTFFFTALLLNENLKITNTTLKELQTRLASRKGAFKYGTAQESEIFSIEAEVLKIKQQITSLEEDKTSNINSLNLLTGLNLSQNATLTYQDETKPINFNKDRPEYQFFDLQKKGFDNQLKVVNSKLLPKISLFGEANYGRPGFNFLRTDFGEFWIVGAKISWNISSLYNKKQESNLINLQQKQVDIQSDVFSLNQSINFNKQQSNINKLEKLLTQDDEIIDLKQKVLKASAAKLENGTMSITDYLTDVQAEQQAEQNKALHQARKMQSIAQLKLINGN